MSKKQKRWKVSDIVRAMCQERGIELSENDVCPTIRRLQPNPRGI